MELRFKTCSSCKEHQSLDEFPLNKCVKSGYDYKCKKCHRESWHRRKPPVTKINHVYPRGWVLDAVTIREILKYDKEIDAFRWIVEHAHHPVGSIAGTTKGIDSDRISINGKRYRIDHLKAFWNDGVMPVKKEKIPREYEDERMRDIQSHSKFFDWSCVWTKEKAKKQSQSRYDKMTIDERREYWRSAARKNKNKRAEYNRTWRKENKQRNKETQRSYIVNNRSKIQDIRRSYRHNPKNRTQLNLRRRFKEIMRSVRRGKSTSFSETVGCTIKELAAHLESKFKRGMTWSNYGSYWHVDHIIPVAAFNHLDPKQVKQCWHWTNLQPLEADKNMAKSDNITHPQLSLCI